MAVTTTLSRFASSLLFDILALNQSLMLVASVISTWT